MLPVLNDVFGNGYEGNLEALGKGSDQVRDVVDGLIVQPFRRDASLERGGGWFDATQGKGKTPFWWEVRAEKEIRRTTARSFARR